MYNKNFFNVVKLIILRCKNSHIFYIVQKYKLFYLCTICNIYNKIEKCINMPNSKKKPLNMQNNTSHTQPRYLEINFYVT